MGNFPKKPPAMQQYRRTHLRTEHRLLLSIDVILQMKLLFSTN